MITYPTTQRNKCREIIRVGISHAFLDKENPSGRKSNFIHFPVTELTLEQLADHILAGKAWTPGVYEGKRDDVNWRQAEFIALDYDENVSVADCLAQSFIRDYAFLVHPSASSSPAKKKTRVLLRLSSPIQDSSSYRTYAVAIAHKIGLPIDTASFKPSQLFYGSTNQIEKPHINYKAVLPLDYVETLAKDLIETEYKTTRKQLHQRSDYREPNIISDASVEQVREALRYIPGDRLDYNNEWIPILAGVASAFDDATAISLLEEWTGSYCRKQDEVAYRVKTLKGASSSGKAATLGTVFYHAQRFGYRFSHKRPRSAASRSSNHIPTTGQLTSDNLLADHWRDLPDASNPPAATFEPLGKPAQNPEHWSDFREGVTHAELWHFALYAPVNTNVLFYTACKLDLIDGFDPHEMAAATEMVGLELNYDAVVRCLKAGEGEFFAKMTTESYGYSMGKNAKNSGGRPAQRWRLMDREAVHSALKRMESFKLPLLAAKTKDRKKALPTYAKREYFEALNIQGDLEGFERDFAGLTDQAKVQDYEYRDDIRRSWSRFRYLRDTLIESLASSDFADFDIDPDIAESDATAIMKLAAQRLREDHARKPDKIRSLWHDEIFTGTSKNSTKKVRKLAKLRHAQQPKERVAISANSADEAMKSAQTAQKAHRGRITRVSDDGVSWMSFNQMNVKSCLDRSEESVIYYELSVARPLERYEPEPTALQQVTRQQSKRTGSTKPEHSVEPVSYAERLTGDATIIKEALIDCHLERLGWSHDPVFGVWRDPDGVYWPDHAPTLAQRLTGRNVLNAQPPVIAELLDYPGSIDPLLQIGQELGATFSYEEMERDSKKEMHRW